MRFAIPVALIVLGAANTLVLAWLVVVSPHSPYGRYAGLWEVVKWTAIGGTIALIVVSAFGWFVVQAFTDG